MKKKIHAITQILTSEVLPEIGLLTGIGGQILFCNELGAHKEISQDWLSRLHNVLEEKLSNEDFAFTHCDGLAGIGWLYEYLSQRKMIDYNTNLLLEEFDNALKKALKGFMLENDYEFLYGGVGIASYFIRRATKKKELIYILNQFLEDLEKSSTRQENGGIKWISSLGDHEPKWGYNLSLSHGMASIVSILSKIYKIEGVNKIKTKKLLHGAVQYILAQEIVKEIHGSYFPNYALESTSTIYKSRLAWCYGDLGIASALFQAGTVLKENAWIDKALEIFLFTATQRRSLEDNNILDAGLCHGASGIGHIFYRMWWNTKLPEFKDAADYWFDQTLKMAKFEDGLAGFKTYRIQEDKPVWLNEYGLLGGITGIGLALLTYYYETEPTWDECLLLC
ncbi:MAG: lanthionine synthetase C family protein [Bacteroidetes bacterium]|nr:lanthionine synthetase C family protein [Bacteroidota bacterium]MCL2302165.1 lanthionine synthetase C family protein [Lentimicrobiaceae bacterium]